MNVKISSWQCCIVAAKILRNWIPFAVEWCEISLTERVGGRVPVLVCERDIEQWREREIEKGLKGKHGVHISLSVPIAPTKQCSHRDISTILRLIAPCPPTPGMDLQFAPRTDTYILSPLTYLASQPVAILISTSHQLTART